VKSCRDKDLGLGKYVRVKPSDSVTSIEDLGIRVEGRFWG